VFSVLWSSQPTSPPTLLSSESINQLLGALILAIDYEIVLIIDIAGML
jgi:hypothetical protein